MVSERVLITGGGDHQTAEASDRASELFGRALTHSVVPVLFFFLSRDTPLFRTRTAMTPTEVTEKLGLLKMSDRSWYCHPSNALDGSGLSEGECGCADTAKKEIST